MSVRRSISRLRPNVYKTQKAAQKLMKRSGPTVAARDPESIKQYLEHDQYNLYKLIWNRFIASQMVPAIWTSPGWIRRLLEPPIAMFRTTGTVVKFPRHTAVYLEGNRCGPSRHRSPRMSRKAEENQIAVNYLRWASEGSPPARDPGGHTVPGWYPSSTLRSRPRDTTRRC